MTKMKTRNEIEKDFTDTFNQLAYVHSGWQAWSDFVHCAAYAISNAVDPVHREAREKDYMRIVSKYKEAEGQAFARLLSATVMALEENPDQDFLGHIYMNLEMGNKHLGQCFTPFHLCKMMAKVTAPDVKSEIEGKGGWISVADFCIGGGAMLIGFVSECRDQKVDFQSHCLFVGQDIDHTVAMMAYIQLSLLGCPGYIVVGNALTEPLTNPPLFAPMERETFVTPMYCSDVWEARRAWSLVGRLFHAATSEEKPDSAPATAPEATAEPVPALTEPSGVPEQVSFALPISEPIPAKEPVFKPTIAVRRAKKGFAEDQISMFDMIG